MFQLSDEYLNKYARVIVHFAIHSGTGIKPGETVLLVGNESAKPLYLEIYKEIVRAGGNVILHYLPDEFDRFRVNAEMVKNGTREQLSFFPEPYYKGLVESIDHHIAILSTVDRSVFKDLSAENSTMISSAMSRFFNMRSDKEQQGKLSWVMCHWGTPAAASDAGMTEEEYWQEIIKACYLEDVDPVATWRRVQQEVQVVRDKLDALKIQKVHVVGPDVDLHIAIGSDRKWLGGTERNIPSFEVFTSPDWRGVHGTIRFNQPLNYLGKRITGISLSLSNGVIIAASAQENEDALLALISRERANMLGEFSLTHKHHSRITKCMGNTLFDENMGGEFGNMHVAVGRCFPEAYSGDRTELTEEEWHTELGFNQCKEVHIDMISTSARTVTATLEDGKQMVIYENGEFTI